jgi:glycosyltransferase involved in cell wall biosynthesis
VKRKATRTPTNAAFAIVSNGFADGPAQALRDFLVARGATVHAVAHPLTPEDGKSHVLTTYRDGEQTVRRAVRLPLRPPLSYGLDPFIPLRPPSVDAWFGFNPLACARGLLARTRGRAGFVVLWSVDFVPDRFGRGTILTRIYDRLDTLCCTHADGRVELSDAARTARNERHGLGSADAHVVPMGAWTDRVPTTPIDGYRSRRVAFLGHLVERQGVDTVLQTIARTSDVTADIVGTGPLDRELHEQADRLGIDRRVRFHGFVEDHRDVERILAECSIAVAPYRSDKDTFTRYADPGKLKAYLAAGLPIVLTDVPPNARELELEAGAQVVDDDPAAVAQAVVQILSSEEDWRARRASALAFAHRFDWNALLTNLLDELGLGP